MKQAKAGWTSFDITPPLGLPMGGRGARFTPGSHVRDPLYGFLTLLEDAQGRRLALLSLDLIGLGAETTMAMQLGISGVTGAPVDSVIINCSHTHSGPMTHWSRAATLLVKSQEMLEYERDLLIKVQQAAGEAMKRLAPVTVRWHEGVCDVGINRRKQVNGETAMGPNPQGSYNAEMIVIHLQGEQGQAVLFNYGCHPVIVYSRDWDGISAEWPGKARQEIQSSLGKDTHVQFFQGFAGDVRPRVLADLESGTFRKSHDGDEDQAGREAGRSVVQALKQDPGQTLTLKLASVTGYAKMTSQPGEPLEHWLSLVDDSDELTRNNARYWAKRLADGALSNTHVSWAVGLVRMDDDHLMPWIAGEPLSQWLELLRQVLPAKHLAAMGYTGATGGYLPRDQHLAEGGYEVTRSRRYGVGGPGPLNPGLDQAMTEAFRELSKAVERA